MSSGPLTIVEVDTETLSLTLKVGCVKCLKQLIIFIARFLCSAVDDNDNIENIKDYEGNLVNKISFKINGFIQDVCDFGFDLFKKALKSFLE